VQTVLFQVSNIWRKMSLPFIVYAETFAVSYVAMAG
jgi:hypothetical protein